MQVCILFTLSHRKAPTPSDSSATQSGSWRLNKYKHFLIYAAFLEIEGLTWWTINTLVCALLFLLMLIYISELHKAPREG